MGALQDASTAYDGAEHDAVQEANIAHDCAGHDALVRLAQLDHQMQELELHMSTHLVHQKSLLSRKIVDYQNNVDLAQVEALQYADPGDLKACSNAHEEKFLHAIKSTYDKT